MYTVTEGMDSKVSITLVANGAVDESSFSVRVIAKDGTATSGYIYMHTYYTYIESVRIHNYVGSMRMWAHRVGM